MSLSIIYGRFFTFLMLSYPSSFLRVDVEATFTSVVVSEGVHKTKGNVDENHLRNEHLLCIIFMFSLKISEDLHNF